MNELITVNFDTQTVSARELHKALGIEKRFSAWFETNSQGFVEGEDFTSVLSGTVVNNGAKRELNRQIDELKHNNMLLEQKIEADKPKTIFADAVSTSHTSILIGDLAKLICQNGVQIGQKRLFDWLRDNGYLIKCGLSRNMPMQRYVEQGLFEVKESTVQNPDGSVRITKTTKVTGKGQVYFVNKFLGGAV